MDEETGLYYYGARYYNPRESVWLSVDPLAERHPDYSPYAYCAQNPVNLVDPNGEDWYKRDSNGNWIRIKTVAGDTRFYREDGSLINQHVSNLIRMPSFSQEWIENGAEALRQGIMSSENDNLAMTIISSQTIEENARLLSEVVVLGTALKSLAKPSFWKSLGKGISAGWKGITKFFSSSKASFDPDTFADTIVTINKTTQGGGVLLGGSPESAVNSAMYYESSAEQGASIFRSIAHGHMFQDGNKRTAVKVFKEFAKQNKLRTVSNSKMEKVASEVAQGHITDVTEISKQLVK